MESNYGGEVVRMVGKGEIVVAEAFSRRFHGGQSLDPMYLKTRRCR